MRELKKLNNMCPNCDRGLVHKTNEFCEECKGTGVLSANETTMPTETEEVVTPEAPVEEPKKEGATAHKGKSKK